MPIEKKTCFVTSDGTEFNRTIDAMAHESKNELMAFLNTSGMEFGRPEDVITIHDFLVKNANAVHKLLCRIAINDQLAASI